jgi:hypothetical protein
MALEDASRPVGQGNAFKRDLAIEEGNRFLEASLPPYNKMPLACPMREDKPHGPLTKGLHVDATYNEIYVYWDQAISVQRNLKSFT